MQHTAYRYIHHKGWVIISTEGMHILVASVGIIDAKLDVWITCNYKELFAQIRINPIFIIPLQDFMIVRHQKHTYEDFKMHRTNISARIAGFSLFWAGNLPD